MLKIFGGLIVVLLLLFVAADYVARSQAEKQAGKQLASSLELDDEPDVKLGGWPFLLKALGGELPSASFSAEEVRSNGVTLSEVEVDVTDLSFSFKDILSGSGDAITIGGGDGTAVLLAGELSKVLRRESIDARVRFTANGVRVKAARLPQAVEGDIAIDAGNLVITAGGSTIGTVRLPQIAEGLTYDEVTIEEKAAVLSFSLSAASLTAP